MSPQKNKYQAYSIATRTVAKTRQIVMLYDGAIRFLKQAQTAAAEKRIEDRFLLLKRASDVILGLQSSLDFENGGEVAGTLNKFYTNISLRILSVNFHPKEACELCEGITSELKQMRDIWDSIDSGATQAANPASTPAMTPGSIPDASGAGNVTLSA
jgi:flagellar protein FliS